jgi:hypothetical protein
MSKIILLCVATAVFAGTFAQDPALREIQGTSQRKTKFDSISTSWVKGGVFALNVGQGGSRNWAAGAEKFSFSVASSLSLFANRKFGNYSWRNTLDLGYALVRTTSLGTRKTDDKIDLLTKFARDLSTTTSLGLVGTLRTQFSSGYDYDYLGKGLKRRTSDFFAPAYAVIAPGIDWHPKSYFSVFVAPVAARFIIVTNEPKSYFYQGGVIPVTPEEYEVPLSVLYGVDPARGVRNEIGGFLTAMFGKDIFKNVTYKTRVDLFSNYMKTQRFTPIGPDQLQITDVPAKPQNVDVFWTNTLVMKVNNFLNVSYNFDLIYDDDVRQFGPDKTSAATQLRSMLGIGIAASF